MEIVSAWLQEPQGKAVVIAVVLVILLLILFHVSIISKPLRGQEGYVGSGMAYTAQTIASGPNMRLRGTELSATNQQDYSSFSIPDYREAQQGIAMPAKGEKLVGYREPYVFPEVGSMLSDYQDAVMLASAGSLASQSKQVQDYTNDLQTRLNQDATGSAIQQNTASERLAAGSPKSMFDEQNLRAHLY